MESRACSMIVGGRRKASLVFTVLAACLAMSIGPEPARCILPRTAVPFSRNYLATADGAHTRVIENGQQVQLVLDPQSAAAFGSKNSYLFGRIGMGIKLVPGNSAGTVTAYYLSSPGATHDELDFEFLGNETGQPYILQTNVYAKGIGGREQRINLWFDPTVGFHTYSVLWNKKQIVFFVDTTPVRVFRNNEDIGVPYPNSQGMAIYTSIWDGSGWATQGGRIKIDWSAAPFISTFQGFGLDACQVLSGDVSACSLATNHWWDESPYNTLNANQMAQLHMIQTNHLVYDYCTDTSRNPTPPVECARNWYLGAR